MSGRYASYWNAFLLAHFFADSNKYQNSSVTNKNNEHIFHKFNYPLSTIQCVLDINLVFRVKAVNER